MPTHSAERVSVRKSGGMWRVGCTYSDCDASPLWTWDPWVHYADAVYWATIHWRLCHRGWDK